MLQKLTKKHIVHGINQAKNFLGNAYHQTKNFLGNVDHGVRTIKHIYGAIAPVLDTYGVGKSVHGPVMKAISGYDNIKHQVMEHHNRASDNIHDIKNNLGKKHIRFDFS
jgi:hypothetical protein